MKGAWPVVACILIVMAGCMGGNSVTVAGQGFTSGSQTKTLDCGSSAQVQMGAQGGGTITVKVHDGSGAQVFSQSVGSGQDGTSQNLSGKAGSWKLTVETGFGYGGQYGIVLSC